MGKLLLVDGRIIKLYIDLVVSFTKHYVYLDIFIILICYSVTDGIMYKVLEKRVEKLSDY